MRGLATILAAASCAVYAGGCSGTCGFRVPPGAMDDGGFAAFSGVPVGTSVTTNVPIQDSAEVDETVIGSSLAGGDAAAFKVLSTFPMPVPAGTIASVTVEFTPRHAGPSSASLLLDTASMGQSQIPLAGSAF